MKKLLIALALGLLTSSSAWAEISFAILPVEGKGGVSQVQIGEAETSLYKNMIESHKFKIVDRNRIQAIMQEQRLQTSGVIDPNKIVELGKIAGADKLIATTLYKDSSGDVVASFSVIDITTGSVERTAVEGTSNFTASDQGRMVAANILNSYPLLGEILGDAKGVFIIDLGQTHGLKPGDRLFVERKTQLLGDDGEVLFNEENRVGQLEVVKVSGDRTMTKLKSSVDANDPPAKGDWVSPEPIPMKDAVVSTTPLLPNITEGKLLLEDEMDQHYLVVNEGKGEAYRRGKLHLDATGNESIHAYTHYPPPWNNLDNFIIEGDVEFQPIEGKYQSMAIEFRSSGGYIESDSYFFLWYNDGEYRLGRYRQGKSFYILKGFTSPAINPGLEKNHFKVVAVGSKIDCYMNGKFVVGFEDEYWERGEVGFLASSGGYSVVDDVKLWEPVQR